MINGHGDDGYLFDKEIVADFSSNVYYKGASVELKKHLEENLSKINNYPEVTAQSLQRQLAQWHKLGIEQVMVTNGATEAFYLIAHAYRRKSATIIVPAFAEYEDACKANDLEINYLDWSNANETSEFQANIVFFGNPNNPTGATLSRETILNILLKHPNSCFVIDEAYVDFTNEKISMVDFLHQHNNLIIVKSLTKTYAIPGLRLGYVLSNPSLVKQLLTYKMPWSVNALAIEAGLHIIKSDNQKKFPLEKLLQDADKLISKLKEIENIAVLETKTNFFLCKTNKGTAADLKQFLINEYGMLIRDASNFKSLGPQHFRIASQTPEKNELLIKGIRTWMSNF